MLDAIDRQRIDDRVGDDGKRRRMPASPPPLTLSGLPEVGSSASSTEKLGIVAARGRL
jgi:hypothetical protein